VYETQFKIVLAALLLIDAGIRLYYQRDRKIFERAAVKRSEERNSSIT